MKRYRYFIHTILVSVLMTSCIHYNEEQSVALSDAVTDITVSEARSFYENDIMSRADAESPKIKTLSPGDYTPQWDNAEMSQNNRIACVDNGGYVTIGNNLTDAFGAGNITGVRPFSDKMPFVICN